jgi:predicted nucleotide-binding protein
VTAEQDLKRHRDAANRLRLEISKLSTTVAAKRKKATDATRAAARSKSAGTIRMKTSEAERATKEANDAERKRALAEKKLADLESAVSKDQERVDKERASAQNRAIRNLQRTADQAASQFAVPADYRLGGQRPAAGAGDAPAKDVFLSHASEDKDAIARPLQEALEARGVSVWFDAIQIKVGHSIRQEIERGIANCKFGVVIVSPSFFAKQWTNAELDGLFSKRMTSGRNLILPIWHHISKDDVMQQSPLLAGIHALNSATMTADEMADALLDVVNT